VFRIGSQGYIPAVVTPFRDGRVDFAAFEKYVEFIIVNGVSGIVVCGSTGESLSLTSDEKSELIRVASGVCRGRVNLIAGVISPITADCVEFMRKVEDTADGFLCICPFYIKPSQEQIYNHFKALSSSTSKSIILYNNPSRVGTCICLDTYERLAIMDNIVATKECSQDIAIFSTLRGAIGDELLLFSGNDDSAPAAFALGACGAISVTANVAPKLCVRMFEAFTRGEIDAFTRLRDSLSQLHSLLFMEPTPAPVKYVLSRAGLMQNELRPPLSPITEGLQRRLDAFMDETPCERHLDR
jgi:4-hydroxy-tetrahydrodipicolinate synthase